VKRPDFDPSFVKAARGYNCGLCGVSGTTGHHLRTVRHKAAEAAYWPVPRPDLKPDTLYEIWGDSPKEHRRIMGGFDQCWHSAEGWGHIYFGDHNYRYDFYRYKPIFYVDHERRPVAGFVIARSRKGSGCTFSICRMWVAPEHRGKGIMTRCWKAFEQRYGELCVIEPSDATLNYMGKHGCWQNAGPLWIPIKCEEVA